MLALISCFGTYCKCTVPLPFTWNLPSIHAQKYSSSLIIIVRLTIVAGGREDYSFEHLSFISNKTRPTGQLKPDSCEMANVVAMRNLYFSNPMVDNAPGLLITSRW